MTALSRASLKSFFETGDVPAGSDYANLIDSCLNIVDTATQNINSAINPVELITPRVSATNANFTGTVSAQNVNVNGTLVVQGNFNAANQSVNNLTVTQTVSADKTYSNTIVTSALTVNAASINIATYTGFVKYGTGIVSAAGTTQGTAASLTNIINRGKGIADGATTGFTPPANNTGLVQYLFNEGASANLWPPLGGTINGLAANAAFPLAASAMVTIIHLTASAMAAK